MVVRVELSPEFYVDGPYKVPTVREAGGKRIDIDRAKSAFCDGISTADKAGCYVFAIRRGKGGLMPWYVGKTTRTFRVEAFTGDKENKYNKVLNRVGNGAPVIFFITYDRARGGLNKKWIDRLERYLIEEAGVKNQNLVNSVNAKLKRLQISGVLHLIRGKRSRGAKALSRMFEA